MRYSGAGLAAGAALLACGGPAQSHALFGFQGPGFSGALHLLASPLALAALAAAVALLYGQPGRRTVALALLIALAAIGGGVLAAKAAVPGPGAALCVAVAGAAAAAGVGTARGWLALPLAVLAGLGVGLAVEFDAFSVAALLGMAIAVAFSVGSALTGLGALGRLMAGQRRWLELGLRVLGSWAAAIGLLLGALALRTG